jgi:hypothetical protein
MRKDLKELLIPDYIGKVENVYVILQLIQNPALLFEFEPLADIFARDVIPSQIMLDRKPTLFNPAALTSFGLP